MSTKDPTMDLGPAGLISGNIKGAVEHILDELACHGYSDNDIVKISVLLEEAAMQNLVNEIKAALDEAMNEAQDTNQMYPLYTLN